MESQARVSRIAYAILLVMGLVALVAIGASASNYMGSARTARGLRLEITNLQVIDDDNPRAVIHFKLHNRSPLEVGIERYNATIYLNGELVATSMSLYTGTDPTVSPSVYRKAVTIDQVLGADQDLDLELVLYIYAAQIETVRQAQRSGTMSWSTRANFRLILPYAREEDWVELSATFEE